MVSQAGILSQKLSIKRKTISNQKPGDWQMISYSDESQPIFNLKQKQKIQNNKNSNMIKY